MLGSVAGSGGLEVGTMPFFEGDKTSDEWRLTSLLEELVLASDVVLLPLLDPCLVSCSLRPKDKLLPAVRLSSSLFSLPSLLLLLSLNMDFFSTFLPFEFFSFSFPFTSSSLFPFRTGTPATPRVEPIILTTPLNPGNSSKSSFGWLVSKYPPGM